MIFKYDLDLPFSNKISTILPRPCEAATCRAVRPKEVHAFRSVPVKSNYRYMYM